MLLNSLGNTHYPIWGDSIHGQGDFLEGATIPRSQIEMERGNRKRSFRVLNH